MRDDNLIEAMARGVWGARQLRLLRDDPEAAQLSYDELCPSVQAELLWEAHAALAALQREQWVPVSERLPPEGADVLALHDYGQIVGNPAHRDCGKRYGYQITRRYGNGFLSDLLETGQVTHWMPLPDAPQPEDPRGINVSGHNYVRRSATSYVCRRCGHDMCREPAKPCANQ